MPAMGRRPPAWGRMVCHWRAASSTAGDMSNSARRQARSNRSKASGFERRMKSTPNSTRSVWFTRYSS